MNLRILILVVFFLTGCDPSSKQASKKRPRIPRINASVKKHTYDFDSCMGIHDPDAPNETLWEWLRSSQPSMQEFPGHLLTAIESGERIDFTLFGRLDDDPKIAKGILDLSSFRIRPQIRDVLLKNDQIKWLHLGETTTASDFDWIGKMHQLVGLRIANANLADADFSKLKNLKELRWLSLASLTNLPDDFQNWPVFPKLETIDLHGDSIPNEIVSVFNQCTHLRSVHFDHSSIGDEGVKILVENHSYLIWLNLYRSEVTAQSVDHLIMLKHLGSLGVGLTPLSPEIRYTDVIKKLDTELPHCRVDYGG